MKSARQDSDFYKTTMEPRDDLENDSDNIRQLTIKEKVYAAAYLNETDENRENAVAEIKRWIQESDDLCAPTDNFFILRFLRVCKFNIERTKFKIRNYHQQRSDLPEWYMNRNPLLPEMQKMYDLGVFLPLRGVDEHGRMVVIGRATVHDPYKQTLTDLIKASIMMLDIVTKDHVPSSINGIVSIIDLTGVTFGHVFQIRPNILRNVVHTWQGCYPLRIKSIIFINAPVFVDVVLSILKKFLNAKLKERLFVHRDISHMEGNWRAGIPDNILPVEYGGTDDTIENLKEYWKKVIEENRDWLADNEKCKVISTA